MTTLHSAFGIAKPAPVIEAMAAICEGCNRPAPFVNTRRPSPDDDFFVNVGPCCDPTITQEGQ